jgi:hypothetical protein
MTDQRRVAREQLVIEHMESENVQEWDRTMATFSHARYELPDGQVVDGHDDVMRYWIEGRTVVPDQRNELITLEHPNDDCVLIHFWLRGSPTNRERPFERTLWAIFDFDERDLMINERVYIERPTDEQIAGRVTTDGRPA